MFTNIKKLVFPFLGLAITVIFALVGGGTPIQAAGLAAPVPPTNVVAVLRDAASILYCFNPVDISPNCHDQYRAPELIVVRETVNVKYAGGMPTGTVTFASFAGLNCTGLPAMAKVAVIPSGVRNMAKADSPFHGPLAAGNYSFKAIYDPDAAAMALGIKSTPAPCLNLWVPPGPFAQ